MSSEIATVQAWQAAANDQDIDRLLALSAADIAIIGPRGRGSGHQILRDWIARAGLTLTTYRIFQRRDTVVLAQHARWQSDATGVWPVKRSLPHDFASATITSSSLSATTILRARLRQHIFPMLMSSQALYSSITGLMPWGAGTAPNRYDSRPVTALFI
jgi:hypothetical protein